MKLAALVLLLALAPAPAADVKGKWQGKLTAERDDGSTHEDTALLILHQEGATVTGTFGGSESDQYPITRGTVEGNNVRIVDRTANGHEFHLELTLKDGELQGTIKSVGTRRTRERAGNSTLSFRGRPAAEEPAFPAFGQKQVPRSARDDRKDSAKSFTDLLTHDIRTIAIYLIPTTMESGPARCSTQVSRNSASRSQPEQSAPV